MTTKKAPAATLAVLALAAVLLTGCSDGQTDENPCGDTGKPSTGSVFEIHSRG